MMNCVTKWRNESAYGNEKRGEARERGREGLRQYPLNCAHSILIFAKFNNWRLENVQEKRETHTHD